MPPNDDRNRSPARFRKQDIGRALVQHSVRSLVQLVGQLPISIAGLGVREGTLVGLLPLYGVSASAAVAFSFLLLARTVALGIGGALLEARYRLAWGR